MGILKPKTEKIHKRDVYGFDTETYGKENSFLMGSIVGKDYQKVTWNKTQLQKLILLKRFNNSYIFATNLGFDFFALFDDIRLYSQFELRMRGDRFIAIIYKKDNANITFLDTYNFLKLSVHDLGKILNIPKLEKPKFLGQKPKDLYEKMILQNYNIQDSTITYAFGSFLQDSFNLIGTNIKHTAPATSMSLFRNKYLKFHIKQPKREIIKELYSGYYGGRNEAFYRGKVTNMNYYDINSLYPYVMKTYQYPYINSLQLITKNISDDLLKYEGMSLCSVDCPYMKYPLLPYRYNNKLCFPIGKFQGYYTHAEIRKAKTLGYKIKLLKTYVCTENFNPFVEFVTDLFNKRLQYQKEKNPLEVVYKTCSNSLYGKFGQKIEVGEILFLNDKEMYKKFVAYCEENGRLQDAGKPLRYKITSPHEKFKKLKAYSIDETELYYVVDLENEEYSSFINPMIAAYITAYARLELYNLIEKAKIVYYVDTDSVMTPNELNISKELGGLKKEIFADEGIIVKPKFYYLKSSNKEFVKSKGLSNLKTFLEFEDILKTKHFKYRKMTKFRESLKRRMSFNEIIEIEKLIDLEDNKRVWKKPFNPVELQESEPLILNEIIN